MSEGSPALSPEVRRRNIQRLKTETLDALILGGGINGTGVARDLALRARRGGVPLKTGLVEQRHFASGTSGKNSQLIHGGLRYLKNLEFSMVRESLRERAVLLELAPHLVEPLPFLIPMYHWFDRIFYGAGLWLYDLLAGDRKVSPHRNLSRQEVRAAEPGLLQEGLAGGAIFYDCRIHSARFVLESILDAAANGAIVANYVCAGEYSREDAGLWKIPLTDTISGEPFEARARKIVNATGAWAGQAALRLVRGSHIVLPRVTAGDKAIAHFDETGRIVFLIPWGSQNQLTLVGTTDLDHNAGPDDVRITDEETAYLFGIVKKLFPWAADLSPLSSFSSLRPLLRDESSSPTVASREHRIWESNDGVVHIAGGKYTTYRVMSEEAAELVTADIAPSLTPLRVTAQAPLQAAGVRMEDLPLEAQAEQAVNREMAQRLADLLFVSAYLGYERRWDLPSLEPYALEMGRLLNWDRARIEQEIGLVLRLAAVPALY